MEIPLNFRVNNTRFWLRIIEQGLLFFAGAALALAPNVCFRVLGAMLLGIVYARNLEFVHECLHGTALTNRRLGRIIGRLLALPMFVSFAQWRVEHAQHHRDIRREGFRYEYERLTSIPELFLHLLMVRHFARAGGQAFEAISKTKPTEIDTDHLMMLAALTAGVLISIALRSPLVLWLWLLPLVFAAIVHTHIELPEHFGCERDTGDAFRNSRIIPANRFVTWFVNANNYHALHHWDARIPNDKLPNFPMPQQYKRETYYAFFTTFYRALLRSSFGRGFGGWWTCFGLRRD